MASNKKINKVVYEGKTLVDLTSDTVTADKLLKNYTAHDKSGAKIIGTMTNNGSIEMSISGLDTTYVTIPAGYTSGGVVNLTSDIENALAKI